jgi:hypothetical protein
MKRITILLSLLLLLGLFSKCTPPEYDLFATLYGVVSDYETGTPLSNASVVLGPGGKTKTTGTDGRFEFNDLEAQQYTITVQKTDYVTNRKTITAVPGEKTEVNIPLTKSN